MELNFKLYCFCFPIMMFVSVKFVKVITIRFMAFICVLFMQLCHKFSCYSFQLTLYDFLLSSICIEMKYL